LLANISELDINLASDLIENLSRKTYATRFSDCFETGSDVHAIAIETGIIEDDITLVYANPELHLTRRLNRCIALRHILLDGHRTLECVEDAGKLSENTVASRINYTPAKSRDYR